MSLRLDISAVIFDLDGLVLDSEITYFSAWKQAADTMGCPLPDYFCESLSGLHYGAVEHRLAERYGPSFNLEDFKQLSGQYWHKHVQKHGIQVNKGFHELYGLIQRLNLPFCLATNSRLANAMECLGLAGLTLFFPVIVARDHVSRGKPAPDIFWLAAERLSIDISRCLVLEDSPAGIAAATEAGAFTIFIPSSYPVDSDATAQCDLQCHDLNEVAQLLRANLTNS